MWINAKLICKSDWGNLEKPRFYPSLMDGKSNVLRHLGFQIRCKIEVLLVGEGQVRERERLTNCKGGFARSKNRGVETRSTERSQARK